MASRFHLSLAFVLLLAVSAFGQYTLTVPYYFQGRPTDGGDPVNGVAMDQKGNLFGVTPQSDSLEVPGYLYEVSPDGQGGWTFQNIFTFPSDEANNPDFAQPLVDPEGAIYGSSQSGKVWKVSPDGQGGWTEEIVHDFSLPGSGSGWQPFGNLALDAQGRLLGVVYAGGPHNNGGLWRTSKQSGQWVMHWLVSNVPGRLEGGPTIAPNGDIYLATSPLYDGQVGSVWRVFQKSLGIYRLQAIHHFDTSNQNCLELKCLCGPQRKRGDLVLDSDGNIYGFSGQLRSQSQVLYRLKLNAKSKWSLKKLHGSVGHDPIGFLMEGMVINQGTIYASSFGDWGVGGLDDYTDGTMTALSADANDHWTATILYAFPLQPPNQNSGVAPGIVRDANGNLFAIKPAGLDGGGFNPFGDMGTLFELEPQ